ncbi:discoidin domain-containing protein [Rhodopirellula bahusiensis]|uniref:discoidin domain-containing protein n=1 Tax=Rhodopirellula bahusiensis TaxID=2014065 RepID=UPI003267A6F5
MERLVRTFAFVRSPTPADLTAAHVLLSQPTTEIRKSQAIWLRALVLFAGLLSSNHACANGWGVFSSELRQAESELESAKAELNRLGPVVLRQTSPHVGGQSQMRATPPPQAPWIQIDLGSEQAFDQILLVPAIIGSANEGLEPYAFPQQFRIDTSNSEDFETFQLLYHSAEHDLDTNSPLPVVIETPGANARYLRVTVTQLANVTGRWTFALSEIIVLQGDRNIALGASPQMIDSTRLAPVWHESYLVDGLTPLGPPIMPPHSADELPTYDGVFFQSDNAGDEVWFQIDLEEKLTFDELRLFPVHARQGADYPGYAFPLRFRIEASDSESFDNPRVLFRTQANYENPGNNPVTIPVADASARFVRFISERGSLGNSNKVGLAESEVLRRGVNLAASKPLTAKHWRGDRALSLLVDGESSYGKILPLSEWFKRWKRIRESRQRIQSTEQSIEQLTAVAKQRAGRTAIVLGTLAAAGLLSFVWIQRRRRSHQRADFRMRLAQDLHDEIGSNLAAIARIGEVGEAIDNNAETQEDWRSVRELAGECTESIRETLWLLGGPNRNEDCLADQLHAIANRMLPGLDVQWEVDPQFREFSPNEATQRELVMTFKAMLANIARSANATIVAISASPQVNGWRLRVEDNGDGFDADQWANRMEVRGMGLDGMTKRIKKLGGSLTIDSKPGQGSRLTIEIAS